MLFSKNEAIKTLEEELAEAAKWEECDIERS